MPVEVRGRGYTSTLSKPVWLFVLPICTLAPLPISPPEAVLGFCFTPASHNHAKGKEKRAQLVHT